MKDNVYYIMINSEVWNTEIFPDEDSAKEMIEKMKEEYEEGTTFDIFPFDVS